MNSELPNSEAAIFDLHTLGEADSDTQQLLNVSQILRRLVACKTNFEAVVVVGNARNRKRDPQGLGIGTSATCNSDSRHRGEGKG